MTYKLLTIPQKPAPVGGYAYEALEELPFEVKRIYYIHSANAGIHRGGHAHKKLRQLLFCPYGSVTITLDDGQTRERVVLDDPAKALQIDPCLWREMDWNQADSVLCVMASDYYDEADYLRDYAQFLEYIAKNPDKGERTNGIQADPHQDEPD